MGPDSLYCGKWRMISKTPHDLDLGPAMPNIKLVRDIFIHYDVLKFCIHRSITFFNYRAKRQKRGNTEPRKHTLTLTSTLQLRFATLITRMGLHLKHTV